MNIYPTGQTFQVALAGSALIALGLAARVPALLAFGGAMLLAVALGRVFALATVTKLRSAGFEMVWQSPTRMTNLLRGETVTLHAELRNRGEDDARGLDVRAIASSMLDVKISPAEVDLPAGSRVNLQVTVRARRVGQWSIHGIALEVRGTPVGSEGLFEVPLMFANPHGLSIGPSPRATLSGIPRANGHTRRANGERGPRRRGDGDEIRELRDHTAGDAFKRIAWKASAKRGKLIVREHDQVHEDRVMVFVETSPELWAGELGHAPLDGFIDQAAFLLRRHQSRGDRVGLALFHAGAETCFGPSAHRVHTAHMQEALTSSSSFCDQGLSEDDEREIALRVAEHARPLDASGLRYLRKGDLDGLAARADALRAKAPFDLPAPQADTPREQRLRHYLRCFGVEVRPRIGTPRELAELRLATLLDTWALGKQGVSVLYIFARLPQPDGPVTNALKSVRKQRGLVCWIAPEADSLSAVGDSPSSTDPGPPPDPVALAAYEAVRGRLVLERERGVAQLTQTGVRVLHASFAKEIESI